MLQTSSNDATVSIASGDPLDVRSFAIRQGMSQLFNIDVRVVSRNLDIDFDEVVGKEASFALRTGWSRQGWQGVCSEIEQIRVDDKGLATYALVLQPRAWLMTQRTNYRIFQFETELDVVKKMLGEWGVEFEERVDPGNYKPRKYRCQYGETDFAFISRMLEDAGCSYYFEQKEGATIMVLDDAPQARSLGKPMLRFHDQPGVTDGEFVTRVAISQRVRPGKMTIGDLDYRKGPTAQPRFTATDGLPQEQQLEQFQYEPGAFLYKQDSGGGSTPTADDRGASRIDEQLGNAKTQNRLLGQRGTAKRITFESNALDLVPGVITSVTNHPHRALAMSSTLLVTKALLEGDHDDTWRVHVEVVPTDSPFKPDVKTPRPRVQGLESATVVGPDGEEIHTDEYGRVRVHFHWDREGQANEQSSCWIPTSQPWAGGGFGGINLPRIGQEVLVEFLGGDPDRPVVMGRVFTETQGVPNKLPRFKNVSGLMSESTPRLVMGAADGAGASAPSSLLDGGTPYGMDKIGSLVTQQGPFQASSPTGVVHSWKGSGLWMDDTAMKEICYIQAQKDLNIVVKNSWTSVVGNHRTATIGTDDQLKVENKQQIDIGVDQTITVGQDQSLTVGRDQTITVGQNLTEDVVGKLEQTVLKGITIYSDANIKQGAKQDILIESEVQIVLKVGESFIKITPSEIIIQSADKVHINPKQGEAEEAARKAAADQAAADLAAANAAAAATYTDAMGTFYFAP
ncbi:MAG: type VI secretion system tip protein VgrG [Polyangiaceae bacterium]|jgi:type VI secretion system secreted protein VgrG|nr:type VI secretion system tip protein VgrG [Polyangiaceae bacterium]